jgi:hypothetical protein
MLRLRDPRFVYAPPTAHRRDFNAAIARLGAEIAQLELRTAMRRWKWPITYGPPERAAERPVSPQGK